VLVAALHSQLYGIKLNEHPRLGTRRT
jgi:hypothetical protein